MPTLANRFATALTAKGCREIQSRSAKYRCFTSPLPGQFYWVGRSGALRIGRCRTESYPVTDRIKRLLLDMTPTNEDICQALGI
jgi:hypothetical protein